MDWAQIQGELEEFSDIVGGNRMNASNYRELFLASEDVRRDVLEKPSVKKVSVFFNVRTSVSRVCRKFALLKSQNGYLAQVYIFFLSSGVMLGCLMFLFFLVHFATLKWNIFIITKK